MEDGFLALEQARQRAETWEREARRFRRFFHTLHADLEEERRDSARLRAEVAELREALDFRAEVAKALSALMPNAVSAITARVLAERIQARSAGKPGQSAGKNGPDSRPLP